MGYLGFFICFISMLQASEPSMEWDDAMYKKSLAGPLQIGAATSWHTITRARPQKTFTPDQLKQAKGMARHLMTSIQETMKKTHIKWRPYKSQVLVKAIACVNQSEWFAVRDILLEPYQGPYIFESMKINLLNLAKSFFVLGRTPKQYRREMNHFLNTLSRDIGIKMFPHLFDEDFIPLCIMGVKFKRDDFPNSVSFQRYLAHRTPYAFDPGHFWITMQCVHILLARGTLRTSYPIFNKLLEFRQPYLLFKLLETPVPQKLKENLESYFTLLKRTPLKRHGRKGKWLQVVLLKRLDQYRDWDHLIRQEPFRTNLWADKTESFLALPQD